MAITDGVQRLGAPVRRWARMQKSEYTRGEPRPLGGDLGAMSVYAGLVAAGAAAVRASGQKLPERIPPGDALLLTVATFRLSRRIAKDPVTSPLRAPFTAFRGRSGHGRVGGSTPGALSPRGRAPGRGEPGAGWPCRGPPPAPILRILTFGWS